jgi:hypothetical protein
MKYLKKFNEGWSNMSYSNKLKLGLGAGLGILGVMVIAVNHSDTKVILPSGEVRQAITGEEFTGYITRMDKSPNGDYLYMNIECDDKTNVEFTLPLENSNNFSQGDKITISVTEDTWFFRNDAEVK